MQRYRAECLGLYTFECVHACVQTADRPGDGDPDSYRHAYAAGTATALAPYLPTLHTHAHSHNDMKMYTNSIQSSQAFVQYNSSA